MGKIANGAREELSDEDFELVSALQIAPRAKWSELGPILGRHPSTLSARWERLTSQKLAWCVGHLGGRPGLHCAALIEVEADPARMDQTRQALCALPQVQSVDGASRHADFRLTCLSADWLEMSREVLPLINAVPGVMRIKVSVCTKIYASAEHFQFDVLDKNQQHALRLLAPRAQPQRTLIPDALRPCLEVLQRDGRATAKEIAQATGQHPATVARMLRRALELGMIVVRCELATDYSGEPLLVQWFTKAPRELADRVAEFLLTMRNLRLLAGTTGEANLIFNMQVRDPVDIAEIELKLLAAFPQVDILETCVGISSYKRMGWILDDEGRATGQVVA